MLDFPLGDSVAGEAGTHLKKKVYNDFEDQENLRNPMSIPSWEGVHCRI